LKIARLKNNVVDNLQPITNLVDASQQTAIKVAGIVSTTMMITSLSIMIHCLPSITTWLHHKTHDSNLEWFNEPSLLYSIIKNIEKEGLPTPAKQAIMAPGA